MAKKKTETYIAEQISYAISVPKRNSKGEIITKINMRTRAVDEVSSLIKFTPTQLKASVGYQCKFTVDSSTDKYIAEAVREAHKNDATIMTEAEFIKKTNLPQYQTQQELDAIESELNAEKAASLAKDEKLTKSQAELSKLREKLEKLESNSIERSKVNRR